MNDILAQRRFLVAAAESLRTELSVTCKMPASDALALQLAIESFVAAKIEMLRVLKEARDE